MPARCARYNPPMKTVTVTQALDHIGESVRLWGWVNTVRNMGKIAFIDLRDSTGLLQLVLPADKLPKLALEYVVEVEGEIKQRGEKFVNPKLATGALELSVSKISVANASRELPFDPHQDTRQVNEEVRLKYRYIDLRSERLQANLKLRHRIFQSIRQNLDTKNFTEVETPLLTKGTPEGAREYIVPSRTHPGEFYVLPQSPQQFKQLLMVAGLERYYQFAKCLRDEDLRGDRQPEFTQLDLEMSFVTEEDVLKLNEELMRAVVQQVLPDKKISGTAFPRLTYEEAMEKHGTDKPDLRQDKDDPDELAFCWVTDFPLLAINNESGKIDAVHHPFTAPKPEDIELLESDPTKTRASAYDLVLNGYEIAGGSIRIHQAELQTRVFELLGLSGEEITKRFGHMLEAFSYGAPPHGGIAYGMDRLVMVLAGEANIREVIAFPKNGEARDLMMQAPSGLEPSRLKDANIQASSY